MSNNLISIQYVDSQNKISLMNYADTIIYERTPGSDKRTICAIRFGGYPERVEAMTNAIYGGGSIIANSDLVKGTLYSMQKKYVRKITHDSTYAEATLIATDDYVQADKKDKGSDTEDLEESEQATFNDCPPRNCYIYVNPGDKDALYNEIDSKTSVPLIPEFQHYLIDELVKRRILVPLEVVTVSKKFEAWVLRCSNGDSNVIDAVEDGLRSGRIAISGNDSQSHGALADIKSVTGYLTKFGPAIAERIKQQFVPLFDPMTDKLSPGILEINEVIKERAGYSLYEAQLAVAEAIKRQLERNKVGLVIAECGAGKTKIGVTAIAPVVTGLNLNQQKRGLKKSFNIVLCPSHITEKWVREIEESLPYTFAGIVSNPTDFDKLYGKFAEGDESCYAIISKEAARDGYMRAPAVIWSKSKRAFVCPECGNVIEMAITVDGSKYTVDADQFYFMSEKRENHRCQNCKTPFWTVLNPTAAHGHPWIKIGEYGFVYRDFANQHLGKVKNAEVENKIYEIMDGTFRMRMVLRKYPLSTYIKKHYKGRIDGFIADELHQYNNDSGQGDAMGELFNVAKKVIGMTATLINGYSSGIFYLLYRIVPDLMQKDGQRYWGVNDFVSEYGVVESIFEETEADYNSNRRSAKKKKGTRQLPGVSPLVYSRFLLEHAAFLSLSDMGKDLPEYEEIPVALKMPDAIKSVYDRMQNTLVNVLKQDKKAAKKILSAYLNLLTAYPDQPYGQRPIVHPVSGDPIVVPPDMGDITVLMPKDEKTLEIVKAKIASGEKVLIYTNWTRLDTQQKLVGLLRNAGYRVEILEAKVKPRKREKWVEDRLAEGVQVLIANPSLVETGLDLNAFTTLIYYDIGYKLFTLRQASRRSWRINQTAPRVEVYMLYYMDTMQHKAMKLMGTKLAVAAIIEGGFSEEGLAAMSQCEDMTTIMAKELMLGIKDNVEDVSAAFKKMAILKPVTAPDKLVSFSSTPVVVEVSSGRVQFAAVEFTFKAPTMEHKIIQIPLPEKDKGKKTVEALAAGQLSLFDFTA